MENTVLAMAAGVSAVAVGLLGVLFVSEGLSLEALVFTPDQQGERLFREGDYEEAAGRFANPEWQAAALFRAGEFDEARRIWSGLSSAEAAFNEGNALVMLGKYEDAMRRYDAALQFRPDWEPAVVNRRIAAARAERLDVEAGDMTGGQLGADEIVFDSGKKSRDDEGGEEEVSGGEPMDDAEMRAVWLRRVETKPADFLRAKFAYQHATKEGGP